MWGIHVYIYRHKRGQTVSFVVGNQTQSRCLFEASSSGNSIVMGVLNLQFISARFSQVQYRRNSWNSLRDTLRWCFCLLLCEDFLEITKTSSSSKKSKSPGTTEGRRKASEHRRVQEDSFLHRLDSTGNNFMLFSIHIFRYYGADQCMEKNKDPCQSYGNTCVLKFVS